MARVSRCLSSSPVCKTLAPVKIPPRRSFRSKLVKKFRECNSILKPSITLLNFRHFINLYTMPENTGKRLYISRYYIQPSHRVLLDNDVSFSCVCPIIDDEFRHNIVKVVVRDYFDNVMTKFIVNNRELPALAR